MPRAADTGPLVAVLAAGRARRFGGGKLDAPCAGKPLALWTLRAVAQAGLAPGVIVIPPTPPQFVAAADGWDVLVNPRPDEGLGHSVALAARLAASRARDLLLVLADMPLVLPDHLARLAQSGEIAATRYPRGHPGVPVFVPRARLDAFTDLAGERGANAVLADQPELALLECARASLCDVDTAQDLALITQALESRQES